MKSALFAAIAVSVTLVAVPAAQQRETRERHVYIGVTDKAGTPVQTLAPTDVVVKEDGAVREVTKVSPAPPPSHLMILVDDSAVVDALIPDLRIGLAGLLKIFDGMSPVPQVALMTFGDRPTLVVPYSETTLPVAEAVGKLFARPQSGAHFLDAIIDTAAGMRRAKAARPLIVAFVAESGPEFSTVTHDRVAEALQAARASLWTVTLQSPAGQDTYTEARERAQVTGDVVRDSGGQTKVILNRQGLESGFRALGQALSARLDVTYGRPDNLIPPKRLEVTVKKPDTKVTAPRWAGQ
ncbi:MAG TPA: hypothetical protein VFV98_07705 [Vicinamibacterales bacterium]|nr:hypothetical protein [Vicinamibacterales bacterium]